MNLLKIIINPLRKIYWLLHKFFWRSYAIIAPVSATKSRYRKMMRMKIDLKNPRTLNEKMQYLKLFEYRNNVLVTRCSDKLSVRDYVDEKGCREILNDLYNVYERVEDIKWDELPEKFVLKCTHGSGGNIICQDKNKLDIKDAKRKLKKWLKNDFGLERVEFAYEGIKRKIICEKFIETKDGLPPKDYKIFCSYGSPKMLFVASERYNNKTKFDYYTPEWKWLPVINGHPNAGPMPAPSKLDEMLNYARMLSMNFPIVRIDFYFENDRIIFGEMTFLHFGGVIPFYPHDYDIIFGDLFPIHS